MNKSKLIDIFIKLQRADLYYSTEITRATSRIVGFIAVKHGSFSGGFIGAIIGAVGTVLAGLWAWQGVQDQLSEQRRSNNISEKTLLRSEVERTEKSKESLSAAMNYWGSLNVLGSSAQILIKGKMPNPYSSMFNQYKTQFEMVSNDSRKNFSKIIEELPSEIRDRTSISVIRTSTAYLIKDTDKNYQHIKEAFLREEAEESIAMVKLINKELDMIEDKIGKFNQRIDSLKTE